MVTEIVSRCGCKPEGEALTWCLYARERTHAESDRQDASVLTVDGRASSAQAKQASQQGTKRGTMRKSIVRVGSTVGGRTRGASRVSMALPETPENGRLLFAGRLLSMGDDVQIQQGAIEFLQRLAEPLVVVSVHGARVRSMLVLVYEPNAHGARGS